jgi:hybrid cluster-associated redox disulfide protein
MNFTRKTIIKEAAMAGIKYVNKLQEYGLGCVFCPAAGAETIEQGCKVHGLNEEQIDKLIKELNEIKIKKTKKEEK